MDSSKQVEADQPLSTEVVALDEQAQADQPPGVVAREAPQAPHLRRATLWLNISLMLAVFIAVCTAGAVFSFFFPP